MLCIHATLRPCVPAIESSVPCEALEVSLIFMFPPSLTPPIRPRVRANPQHDQAAAAEAVVDRAMTAVVDQVHADWTAVFEGLSTERAKKLSKIGGCPLSAVSLSIYTKLSNFATALTLPHLPVPP